MVGLAALHRDLGDFDAAERQLKDALDGARTAEQRVRALKAWSDYYEYRGQYGRGIEFAERMRAENEKIQPALMVVTSQLAMLGDYVRAGKADVARRTLAQVVPQLQPPFHTFGSLGEMELHIALENAAAAAQAADTTEQRIRQFGLQHLTPVIVRGRAQIAELRGDCEQAVRLYEEKNRMDPADFSVLAQAARCYRTLGQPRKAIEYAQRTLAARPYHGRANYETALAYLDAGDRARALEHLRRAVQVWSDADASFEMAAEAKAKLKQLESGG
jgi:tetratricopeptide (TPR) repeat protein